MSVDARHASPANAVSGRRGAGTTGGSGYPEADDLEHRLALVAVDHPDVVERYRHGRAMVANDGAERTEDLRKAMLDYRTVLEDLLQAQKTAA